MKVLVHGYGLLSGDRKTIIAGSQMSGITLYNTLLLDGLQPHYQTAFLCGRLAPVPQLVAARRLPCGGRVFEYDARFCGYLEKDNLFCPELANRWYCDRVAQWSNPIYKRLKSVYGSVLDAFSPNLVNTHNLNASSAFVHAIKHSSRQPPIAVATIHDTTPAQLEFISEHQRSFAAFVAISEAVKEELCASGIAADTITMIHNGADLDHFRQVNKSDWKRIAERDGIPRDHAFQILVPARRSPEKGVHVAIKAFALLSRRTTKSVRLVLSGAGLGVPSYESKMRELATELGCSSSVFLLGPVSYKEMPAVYAASDVSLLPSTKREGFGYANLEAMASGNAVVITTAQGGSLDYIVQMTNGVLVPPNDPSSIADALLLLLDNSELADSLRGQARATAREFEADRMVSSYVRLFDHLARPLEPGVSPLQ